MCVVQVVKNKPAYFRQAQSEVAVLKLLNEKHDPADARHIVRSAPKPRLLLKNNVFIQAESVTDLMEWAVVLPLLLEAHSASKHVSI